jgi:very-short-patch-repair endonuclease
VNNQNSDGTPSTATRSAEAFPGWSPTTATRSLLEVAAEQWRRGLVDVSGANRRLFYKPLKVATLDLADADRAALTRLLSGDGVRISSLFPDTGTPEALNRQAQARRAADAIWKKATETEEETGANPARLAVGAVTFTPADSGVVSGRAGEKVERAPSAPLVLLPVRFTLAPGTRSVASLALDGEPELNSALRYVLRTQHGADLAEETLLAAADPDGPGGVVVDPALIAAAAERALQGHVDGWQVQPHLAVDYFGSDRELMLRDLSDVEVLAAHPLVAAMAGDPHARAHVTGEPLPEPDRDPEQAKPDRTPPQEEFLVLDADASQERVIDLALSGRNLVVQGPPGTGKSQTISNLIAECAARGKTVLFVAQKRAAIEAVLGRLDARDLGHLVLEVFDAKTKRAHVLDQLRDALEGMSSTPPVEVAALHKALTGARDTLVAHRDGLHRMRHELGDRSVVELYGRLTAIDPAAQTEERLPVATVTEWGLDGTDRHADVLAELVSLGALDSDWATAPGWNPDTVTSDDTAAAGYDAAVTALSRLSEARDRAEAAAAAAHLPAPRGAAEAGALAALLARAHMVADHADGAVLDPGALHHDELRRLTHAVADRATRKQDKAAGLKVGFWQRRRLRKQALQLTRAERKEDAYGVLREAATLRAAWGGPVTTTSASHAAADAYAALAVELDRLGPLLQDLDLAGSPWDELGNRLRQLMADPRRVRMPAAHRLLGVLDAAGARPLVAAVATRIRAGQPVTPHEAADRLRWATFSTLLEHLTATDPALARAAQPGALAAAATTFRAADTLAIDVNAARVRRAAAEATRDRLVGHPEQQLLLKAELKKRRKLRSLRELLEHAPDAMLAAAPCWAMSPLLVSRYLPALPLFDLVVYDEASQVTVPDAVPSLLRGRQAVVAGDDRQLPPTTVFTKLLDADGDSIVEPATADAASEPLLEDDPETGDLAAARHTQTPTVSVATGYASVLTALGAILPNRTLLWHYRSRDERLIAVSNRYVYNCRLVTFPGPEGDQALRHVIVPPSEGIGAHNKSPEAEVAMAVDLCLEHAEAHRHQPPDRWATLGVIAMGIEHANRIEKALFDRVTASGDPHLLDFFDTAHDEAVFIKNIERVQGDERDHIILSVGYGPSADGRMRYMWGPLLGTYGVNRLNVAISRARTKMTLLTSFTADQLQEGGNASPGYGLMREFVLFAAAAGNRDVDQLDSSVPMNAFEADIYGRLVDAGLTVDPQYGVAGYRLDFAVRHPHEPTRHIVAIEADGATYHSGWTARERDRLRQQHLEALGWRFHRIWSSDYWRDPDAEIDAVLTTVKTAVERLGAGQPAADPAPAPEPAWTGQARRTRGGTPAVASSRRPPAWVQPGSPIGTYSEVELVDLVRWLRADGVIRLPDDELTELLGALGFSRRGPVIVSRLSAAIAAADSGRRP